MLSLLFMYNLFYVVGGCGSGTTCDECLKNPGCGWCHKTNTIDGILGCMEIPKNKDAPLGCSDWGDDFLECAPLCEVYHSNYVGVHAIYVLRAFRRDIQKTLVWKQLVHVNGT